MKSLRDPVRGNPALESFLLFFLFVLGISVLACDGGGGTEPSEETPGPTCPLAGPEADLAAEELAVQAFVIDRLFSWGTMVVILDSTNLDSVGSASFSMISDRLVAEGTMAPETRDAFAEANRVRVALPDSIPSSRPCVRIARSTFPGNWEDFYARFPGSGGCASISKVGFGVDACEAAVYFARRSEILSGRGYFVLLSYADGAWNIRWTETVWRSKRE